MKAGAVTDKTGDIVGVAILTQEQKEKGEVILVSRGGQTVRVPLDTLRVTSRVTQGVILAKIKDKNDAFTGMTVVDSRDTTEDEQEVL